MTVKYTFYLLLSSHGVTAPCGSGPPHYRGCTITLRHTHTLGRTPLDEWSACRRDLYLTDNVRHPQGTDVHVFGGIRTHNPSKGAAQTQEIDSAATGSAPTFYTYFFVNKAFSALYGITI